jgi:hypothetical protein
MNRLALALVAVVAFLTSALPAAEPLDAQARAAVERGLAWLAPRWAPDAPAAVVAARGPLAAPAVAAICGLAFLADGAEPAHDTLEGRALRECLRLVLGSQRADGVFAAPGQAGPMYGHAFATAFVAHALARTGDPALRRPLERAVRLTERCQNAEGGWRYKPESLDADGSATAVQLLGLRAADRAGVAVDAGVVDRAAAYLAKLRNADGGFAYMPLPDAPSGAPRTAAAAVALHAWGKSDAADHARALDYLAGVLAAQRAEHGPGYLCDHFYHRGVHLAQAFWQAGGDHRATHFDACRRDLLLAQQADGSWAGDLPGNDYATAMALAALLVPEGRLTLTGPAPADERDERRALD